MVSMVEDEECRRSGLVVEKSRDVLGAYTVRPDNPKIQIHIPRRREISINCIWWGIEEINAYGFIFIRRILRSLSGFLFPLYVEY